MADLCQVPTHVVLALHLAMSNAWQCREEGKEPQPPRALRPGPTSALSQPAVWCGAGTSPFRASLSHLQINGKGGTSNPPALGLPKESEKAFSCGALVCTVEAVHSSSIGTEHTNALSCPNLPHSPLLHPPCPPSTALGSH